MHWVCGALFTSTVFVSRDIAINCFNCSIIQLWKINEKLKSMLMVCCQVFCNVPLPSNFNFFPYNIHEPRYSR